MSTWMVSEPCAPGTQTPNIFKLLTLFNLKATHKKWPVIFVECMYELMRQQNWKLASAYFEIITNNREREARGKAGSDGAFACASSNHALGFPTPLMSPYWPISVRQLSQCREQRLPSALQPSRLMPGNREINKRRQHLLHATHMTSRQREHRLHARDKAKTEPMVRRARDTPREMCFSRSFLSGSSFLTPRAATHACARMTWSAW